jgi:hypothetical protein
VRHRWIASIMSSFLLSCAAPAQLAGAETSPHPRVASQRALPKRSTAARKVKTAPSTERTQGPSAKAEASTRTDALHQASPQLPPTQGATAAPQHAVAVEGIEGTMSDYDVRTTLEGRGAEFDRCHERRRRARSGWIEFRIRILSSGEVSDVKVHRSSVRNREFVDCYAGVVMGSRFNAPHGGYADVTWKTSVGRSPPRPDDTFERRGRWDTPAGGAQTEPSERSESRRERRRARRHRKRA